MRRRRLLRGPAGESAFPTAADHVRCRAAAARGWKAAGRPSLPPAEGGAPSSSSSSHSSHALLGTPGTRRRPSSSSTSMPSCPSPSSSSSSSSPASPASSMPPGRGAPRSIPLKISRASASSLRTASAAVPLSPRPSCLAAQADALRTAEWWVRRAQTSLRQPRAA